LFIFYTNVTGKIHPIDLDSGNEKEETAAKRTARQKLLQARQGLQ